MIGGLVVAVDALHRRVGKLKFVKTVNLMTAAEDRIESPGDLEATVGGTIFFSCFISLVKRKYKRLLRRG